MASGSSSDESAGDPVKIPVAERMKWLFPKGTPKTELDMQPYLTQIEVSIYTTKKQKKQNDFDSAQKAGTRNYSSL